MPFWRGFPTSDIPLILLLPSYLHHIYVYQGWHYLARSIMAEKLCLQWNDFKKNTIDALGRLTKDNDFSDVTLACEDGQQVEAHKVILAVSSPLFQSLLKKNKHPHPLIYMRGVKSDDLKAIIAFLYCGEANVC